ncbi:MAG: toxin-antitoxin system HicB family antitoxin [Bacteroidales bacterium]|nr:toxin-antitoxin system HicB family antitoxin [Bacteroidales bacterium]MBQ1655721.1 toxin-antitoxin system HicB family antitoxin [Bacteroidales bacterium]MBQ1682975.1 toxin-antitoxin system HicB family antitoxin [Bacteroidales bacterium]MBQ2162511.1 toxin-antitoxin system HicB family antitoxin [Bacteroidales bacterium]MBQ2229041.1 toxin-antitoxin system HicB family antitoxin [Bacteroidales bacterium]
MSKSGRLVLRLTPDLHGEAAVRAANPGCTNGHSVKRCIIQ